MQETNGTKALLLAPSEAVMFRLQIQAKIPFSIEPWLTDLRRY